MREVINVKIADLFETKVEEKIEPVIKVGETYDEHKLASEIGSYVVTPMIEKELDDFGIKAIDYSPFSLHS